MLLCHRFFWPDTAPYASLLRAMGEHFAADGHEVQVLSAQPAYNAGAGKARQPWRERLGKLQVRRLALLRERRKDFLVRGTNAVLFSLRVFLHVLFAPRYDVVMTSTFPPIMLAFSACLASRLRGAAFVYHCMDLHPEISRASGGLRSDRLFRLLRRIDQWTCRHASAVVVLSEDMRRTLAQRTPAGPMRVRVINNFSLPVFDDAAADVPDPALATLLRSAGPRCRFLFAGNLGRFQDLETIVEAAGRLRGREDFELVFVGEGVVKDKLQARVRELGDVPVRFVPFQTAAVARRLVAAADFGLVTLASGIERLAYPSKTLTYLGAGCPLFVLVDPTSELARTVDEQGLGVVVGERTPEAVAAAFRRACDARSAWRSRREAIATWAQEETAFEAVMRRWDDLMGSLGSRA